MTHEGRPKPTGVSVGRVGDPRRAPELKRLEVFIGRWMTEGETAPGPNGASARIVASDIYQWLPGGHFIMLPHTDGSAPQASVASRSLATIPTLGSTSRTFSIAKAT